MKPSTLSPSSLALMQECPRCFWLKQNKVWSRPESIFPSLPSGMDHILKQHFDNFMEKNTLPPEIKHLNLKLFNNKQLLSKWRNNHSGISYQDKYKNILHGAVDNILVNKSRLIVLDYKTRGFPLKQDTHEHYITQLSIYNYLLRKNNYKTEDYSYLLFYHPKQVLPTGEVIFHSDLVKVKINVNRAESLWRKAIKLLNSPCPKKSCVWCDGR